MTGPAGKGLAHVSSKWIPLRNMVAGYHWIDIVQRVNWAMYENLAVGPHTFTVRAHSIDRKSYVDAKRTFVVSAPHP